MEHNGKHYIDGGLIDNFPLQFLDETPGNSLGFVLIDSLSGNELSSASNYIMAIFKCYNHYSNINKFNKYEADIIKIIAKNINFYEAKVDKQQLSSLGLDGYEQAKERVKSFAETPSKLLDVKTDTKTT